MKRTDASRYELRNRYPRLLSCMQWVAILAEGEALCALRDYDDFPLSGGGEAVRHFGGPVRVITEAIRVRKIVRSRFPFPCASCWQCSTPHRHTFDRRILCQHCEHLASAHTACNQNGVKGIPYRCAGCACEVA